MFQKLLAILFKEILGFLYEKVTDAIGSAIENAKLKKEVIKKVKETKNVKDRKERAKRMRSMLNDITL